MAFAISLLFPTFIFAQTPNIRSLASFAMFTNVGAVGNTGASTIIGNVGSGAGAITGLVPPAVFVGLSYGPGPVVAQATADLTLLYNELTAAVPTSTTHTPAFGGGETLTPGIYSIAAAGSVAGTLILDAGGDADAVFIFKFGGAFTTGASSNIELINGTKSCNVFWLAEGAISLAAVTLMKGTLVANNAAVDMAAGGVLDGRMLSTTGAVSINVATISVAIGCGTCIPPPGTSVWLGTDNDWQNMDNWCGGIPIAASNVRIPSLQPFYPILTSGTANFNNIDIEIGASVIVSGSGVCSISGNITNSGLFDLTHGTLNLAGTGMIIESSTILNGTIKNLIISNGGLSSIAVGSHNMLSVKDKLSFLSSNNILTTNNNLTLLSTALITASVTDLTNDGAFSGNSITGNVQVERYIPALRRWRYIAINTVAGLGSKNTVQDNWMEGQTPGVNAGAAGKGMWVTDNAYTSSPANFDATSYSPSIKWYDGVGYTGIGNPITYNIRSHAAYFTYVRGDRGSTGTNSILSNTVLRTFGSLIQGDTLITIPSGAGMIGTGNPYASAIDARKLVMSNDEVVNIYLWDPKLGGLYGMGAFQLLSFDPLLDDDFTIFPGGGSYGLTGSIMNTIESGLGFFIQGSLINRTLTFKELTKTASEHDAYMGKANQQKIQGTLFAKTPADSLCKVDAFQVSFSPAYNIMLDANDARKKNSSAENVATVREGTLLTLDYRSQSSSASDTVFINMSNLQQKAYNWSFSLMNLNEPERQAVLVDNYLATEKELNLNGVSAHDFSVTANAGSSNQNRFMIVFRKLTILPVNSIVLSAMRKNDNNIALSWKAINETNIAYYEQQKSADGISFISFGSKIVATNNRGENVNYTQLDDQPLFNYNYYRIKAVSNNMQVQYTQIVKVNTLEKEGTVTIYPNPVTNKSINVYFKNMALGKYALSVVTYSGKLLYNENIIIDGSLTNKKIIVNNKLASGNYLLRVTDANGTSEYVTMTVIDKR